MKKRITLANIKIPLSEDSDFEADHKTNAFINMICVFDKKTKKVRSNFRLNVCLEDGSIWKGPIKKYDFHKLMELMPLTANSFNRHNCKFQIMDYKLYSRLKSQLKHFAS